MLKVRFDVRRGLLFWFLLVAVIRSQETKLVPNVIEYLSKQRIEAFKDKSPIIVGIIAQPPTLRLHKSLDDMIDKGTIDPAIGLLKRDVLDATFFPTSYSKWIFDNNVLLVPVDTKRPIDELVELAKHLGGLLLPGGKTLLTYRVQKGSDGKPNHAAGNTTYISDFHKGGDPEDMINFPTEFTESVFAMINAIKKRMDDDPKLKIPIFGTCLGFQALLLSEAIGPPILREIDNLQHPAELKVDNSNPNNYLNKLLSKKQVKEIETGKVYYYNHKYAVSVATFNSNANLNSTYDIVGTSMPKKRFKSHNELSSSVPEINHEFDFPFVAAIAHKKYPFFGVQFHPEKNEFETHLKLSTQGDELELVNVFRRNFYLNANVKATDNDFRFINRYFEKFRAFELKGYESFDEMIVILPKQTRKMAIEKI